MKNIKKIFKESKKNWESIHPNFTPELQKEWERKVAVEYIESKKTIFKSFDYEQTKKWIDAGLKVNDAGYARWLRDNKEVNAKWFLNNNDEKKEELKKEYYGLCLECNQLNTGCEFNRNIRWCQPCNSKYFSWSSGNQEIDKFIKKYQSSATGKWRILEWIPYEQFRNVKHLAEGGFGSVSKAEWIKKHTVSWNIRDRKWERYEDSKWIENEIVLKSLSNSQNITTDFIKEVANHLSFNSPGNENSVVRCYGISQNPKTKNYIMVMEYIKDGNLRQYLDKNYSELDFRNKICKLRDIAKGLNLVHEQGLIHHDFHSGNLLNIGKTRCSITDLGLCRPASETNNEKIYGVLPYVAPEVLLDKPYTQAADIYSYGIVAYEVLSGLPPYHNIPHDLDLALKICQGLRPKFQIKIPQLLESLIAKCWNVDPLVRPKVKELEKTLSSWWCEIMNLNLNRTEFYQQYLEAEEFNKTLPKEIRFPKYQIHPQAIYHSKLINTKEITKLLKTEQFAGSKNLNLDLSFIENQLDNLEIIEGPQEQSSTQSQIQLPPK